MRIRISIPFLLPFRWRGWVRREDSSRQALASHLPDRGGGAWPRECPRRNAPLGLCSWTLLVGESHAASCLKRCTSHQQCPRTNGEGCRRGGPGASWRSTPFGRGGPVCSCRNFGEGRKKGAGRESNPDPPTHSRTYPLSSNPNRAPPHYGRGRFGLCCRSLNGIGQHV